MLFGIIILLLVGVIAFFHYLQGLFSATISAILAIISAALAVSYQETVISMLLKGKIADEASGMVMCLLFAAIYIILRTIFDKAVPGNLRFPALVDKIGGAVMGVVAGIYATGIIVLAAQSMPFGPAIGGYSRYELRKDEAVILPAANNRQMQDSFIYNEVPEEDPLKPLDPAKETGMLIPVDDIVLSTVQHLSDNGSLAGDRTLSSIHPDYTQEMFGDRIGIQVGANRSVLNLDGIPNQATLAGLYSIAGISCADPEFDKLRSDWHIPTPPVITAKPSQALTPKPSQVLLVARIMIDHNAADDADKLFRFSTGSIRLVANEKNYFPIGTIDSANILMLQKPDDFLFIDFGSAGNAGLDAAFLVDRADLFGSDRASTSTIPDGRFIEIKRMGRIDLSGKTLDSTYAATSEVVIVRKKVAIEAIKVSPIPVTVVSSETPAPTSHRHTSTPAPTAPPPTAPETQAPPPVPASGDLAKVSSSIPYKIGVNTSDDNAQNVTVAGGTVSLKDSRLSMVKIDPTVTLDKLAAGDSQITDLYVPDGKKAVQLSATAAAQLMDSNGKSHSPAGVYYILNGQGLYMRYEFDKPVADPSLPAGAANASYIFIIPSGTTIKSAMIGGAETPLNLSVP